MDFKARRKPGTLKRGTTHIKERNQAHSREEPSAFHRGIGELYFGSYLHLKANS